MTKSINYEIVTDIIKEMPESKKESLRNALTRNLTLTSSRILEHGTFSVYKEGFYLKLEGCRCSFAVWAKDNDGNLEFGRKPSESKLHKIYDESLHFNESFFDIV